MNMGMIGQIAGPGMQHSHQTDLASNEARIASQDLSGLSRSTEESVIEELLVSVGKETQLGRDGEGQKEIGHRQQQFLLQLEPFLGFVVLAFWTVAIAAGMIAVLGLVALRAGEDLPTQGGCAALLNGAHGPSVAGEQAIGVFLAVGRAVLAEDVCQF